MIDITTEGLADLRAKLSQFSDRRFESALAEAINRTARQVADSWRAQMPTKLDRPTALTSRASIVSKRADVGSLDAVIGMRNSIASGGTPPSEYLKAHEFGTGDRALKKFERALVSSGAMPSGHKAVPGNYAKLDGYGNVSRAQIVAVLNQLGSNLSVGYRQVISRNAAKRAKTAARQGRTYVPITRSVGKLEAGIYERRGKLLLPVFFFVRSTQYTKVLNLMDEAQRVADGNLGAEVMRAIDRRSASLARRNSVR